MPIGILGSGDRAQPRAVGFLDHGHAVMVSNCTPQKQSPWAAEPRGVSLADRSAAADFGDRRVRAVKGCAASAALRACGGLNLMGGQRPTPPIRSPRIQPETTWLRFITNLKTSLMKPLQNQFKDFSFARAFHSVGHAFMINPQLQGGAPRLFIGGNDAATPEFVRGILDPWGWATADRGKVEAARTIEPLCMLWCIPGFLRNAWGMPSNGSAAACICHGISAVLPQATDLGALAGLMARHGRALNPLNDPAPAAQRRSGEQRLLTTSGHCGTPLGTLARGASNREQRRWMLPPPTLLALVCAALLGGCSRLNDEVALRREFAVPLWASTLHYRASPEAAGWFGREGLKVTLVFRFSAADAEAFRHRAVSSGLWRPLPIPTAELRHLAAINTALASRKQLVRERGSQQAPPGSIDNSTAGQLLQSFRNSLPPQPRVGYYQIRTAGTDIMHAPKTIPSPLRRDVNDFMLAVLDPVAGTLAIRVSSNY